MVLVTGGSHTGKSTLAEMVKTILGPLALYKEGATTEAGLPVPTTPAACVAVLTSKLSSSGMTAKHNDAARRARRPNVKCS